MSAGTVIVITPPPRGNSQQGSGFSTSGQVTVTIDNVPNGYTPDELLEMAAVYYRQHQPDV